MDMQAVLKAGGVGAMCCLVGLLIASVLGAAGGGFWGSSHPH